MIIQGKGRPTYLQSKSRKIRLWHRRMGHASNARIVRASRMLEGMTVDDDDTIIDNDSNSSTDGSDNESLENEKRNESTNMAMITQEPDFDELCDPCIGSKHTQIINHKPMTPTTRKLEAVHGDLWGPHDPASFAGSQYGALLLDEFTRKSWVLFIRSKDTFFDAFKPWLEKVEIETQCKLECLRVDGGGEFISSALKKFCKSKGIIFGYVLPYTYNKNSLAERCWRTLCIMKDAMLIDSNLPNNFWVDAMDTANYLRNRLLTSRASNRKTAIILEKKWTGKKQNVSHIRLFGSLASTNISKERRNKSDHIRIWKEIFIGYANEIIKHFKIYAP